MSAMDDPIDNPVTRRRLAKLQGYTTLTRQAMEKGPDEVKAVMRHLARNDLFFLLVKILGREDANNDWVFQRANMIQEEPNGCLDTWSRYHYKTSLGQALCIQDVLRNPEVTICVLSYSKQFAEKIIAPIKLEFENNAKLHELFPDIFYERPEKQSPKWSVKEGFTVKRKGNMKEQTIEGYGLVDSLPTGAHPDILHYDDCETQDGVTSSEAINKLINAWELSLGLASTNLVKSTKKRYFGTTYHHAGLWNEIVKRGAAKLRCFPATKGGKWPGEGVFLSTEKLMEIYKEMGSKNFNAQMLMNPTPSDTALFRMEYIKNNFWTPVNNNLNVYILVDPNNLKEDMNRKAKQKADYFVAWVIGLGSDKNYYVLDVVRDKLLKNQKISTVFDLEEKWNPICVWYFSGGENSDVADIRTRQREINHRFPIEEVPNSTNKHALIPELEGLFSSKRIWLPTKVMHTDWQGNRVDLIQQFIYDEFVTYPFGMHDDMLDALSMIKHKKVELRFPNRGGNEGQSSRYGLPEKQDDSSYDPYEVLDDGL